MTTVRRPVSSVAGPLSATVAGTLAGAATAHLQGVLPADWNTIANSGAIWTLVAFALAAGVARTPAAAAVVGLLALTGEVAGYYLYLADVRHLAAGHAVEVLWTMAALWIGPLTGAAAYRARWGSAAQRSTALLAMAGVLAGEGSYLVRVAGVPRSGWAEISLAAVTAAATLTTVAAPLRSRAAALATGAAVTAAVFTAYRLLAFG